MRQRSDRPSPLRQSAGDRLVIALGASAILWAVVAWALWGAA